MQYPRRVPVQPTFQVPMQQRVQQFPVKQFVQQVPVQQFVQQPMQQQVPVQQFVQPPMQQQVPVQQFVQPPMQQVPMQQCAQQGYPSAGFRVTGRVDKTTVMMKLLSRLVAFVLIVRYGTRIKEAWPFTWANLMNPWSLFDLGTYVDILADIRRILVVLISLLLLCVMVSARDAPNKISFVLSRFWPPHKFLSTFVQCLLKDLLKFS